MGKNKLKSLISLKYTEFFGIILDDVVLYDTYKDELNPDNEDYVIVYYTNTKEEKCVYNTHGSVPTLEILQPIKLIIKLRYEITNPKIVKIIIVNPYGTTGKKLKESATRAASRGVWVYPKDRIHNIHHNDILHNIIKEEFMNE